MSAAAAAAAPSSWFQRFLLPGFAFKAVIIGGGYATGRELAEFFLPSGPWGGVAGMLLAMMVWSLVCVVTFLFARATTSLDYLSYSQSENLIASDRGVAVLKEKYGPGTVRVQGNVNDLRTQIAEVQFVGTECSSSVTPRALTLQLQ